MTGHPHSAIDSALTDSLLAARPVWGTFLGGAWGDRFRLVMVAGSGTTAGALVSVRIVGQRTANWK